MYESKARQEARRQEWAREKQRAASPSLVSLVDDAAETRESRCHASFVHAHSLCAQQMSAQCAVRLGVAVTEE